jgi:hypothetical protein
MKQTIKLIAKDIVNLREGSSLCIRKDLIPHIEPVSLVLNQLLFAELIDRSTVHGLLD